MPPPHDAETESAATHDFAPKDAGGLLALPGSGSSGSHSSARSNVPPTIPGFAILGELGRGGMGVVYKARKIGLNRVLALKMIRDTDADPNELVRFLNE